MHTHTDVDGKLSIRNHRKCDAIDFGMKYEKQDTVYGRSDDGLLELMRCTVSCHNIFILHYLEVDTAEKIESYTLYYKRIIYCTYHSPH